MSIVSSKYAIGIILFVCAFTHIGLAAVLRVPNEFASIGLALSSCNRTDTVLIAQGRYEESVTIPDFFVTLAGEYLLTGDSNAVNATTVQAPVGSLSINAPDNPFADSLRIVGLRFIGELQSGGISTGNRILCVSNCKFDSIGGNGQGVFRITNGAATLSNVVLSNITSGIGGIATIIHASVVLQTVSVTNIDAGQSVFHLEDCSIEIRSLDFSNSGSPTLPKLFDIQGDATLSLRRSSFRNSRVLAGFSVSQITSLVTLDCDSCVFDSISCGFSFLERYSLWAENSTINFRDCVLSNFAVIEGYAFPYLLAVSAHAPSGGQIVRNLFLNNHTRQTSSIVARFESPFQIERNYFLHNTTEGWLSAPGGPTMLTGNQPETFRENIFIGNQGNAVDHFGSSDPGHAEHNYWGHETGPHNRWSNPEALGDTVDTLIFYDPWEADTMFLHPSGVNLRPVTFALGYPFPNPFNSSITIEYALTRQQDVRLTVFDVLGREVENLVDEKQGIGVHSILWNAEGVASGVYFARLSTAESQNFQAVKLLLMK